MLDTIDGCYSTSGTAKILSKIKNDGCPFGSIHCTVQDGSPCRMAHGKFFSAKFIRVTSLAFPTNPTNFSPMLPTVAPHGLVTSCRMGQRAGCQVTSPSACPNHHSETLDQKSAETPVPPLHPLAIACSVPSSGPVSLSDSQEFTGCGRAAITMEGVCFPI